MTPKLLANKSFNSKALLGITQWNNSNNIEAQNKKVKLKISFLSLIQIIKPRILK